MNGLLALVLFSPSLLFADLSLAGKLKVNLRVLTSEYLNGRVSGTESESSAAEFIKSQFNKAGLTAKIEPFSVQCLYKGIVKVDGKNVMAWLPSSATINSKTIVIGAHFDGVGYPAANDNASGTALLLSLAELAKNHKWKHDLVFAAFGAEEKGLCGSAHFVANNSTATLVFMINLDMVGQSLKEEGGPLYVVGDDENPILQSAFQTAQRNSKLRIIFGAQAKLAYEWASDHKRFHDVGIPAVMLTGGNAQDHHKETDTEDKIEYEYLEAVIELLYQALAELDKN